MVERQLPEQFQDLEPFLAWSLATERERSAKRQASTMTEIQTFYDAMLKGYQILTHEALHQNLVAFHRILTR